MTTKFISDDDMHEVIQRIVDSLPQNIEGYMTAYQTYDSDFFEDEDPAFVSGLSSALISRFPSNNNALWIKFAETGGV